MVSIRSVFFSLPLVFPAAVTEHNLFPGFLSQVSGCGLALLPVSVCCAGGLGGAAQ